jgi:lipopolysaccharide biosynthesis glycosyltransferase
VPRWRDAGLTELALKYAAEGVKPLPWVDQDALNAVVGEWCELDFRWNFQQILFWDERRPRSEFTDELHSRRWDLFRAASIVHFVSAPKPWHRHCTLPGTAAWIRTMTRTGWHSRGEALVWLLRYLRDQARYRLGTTRRQWSARIDPR